MSGWRSRREINVVLPLPRKPVTRSTGSLPSAAKRPHQPGVEWVERPPREARRLGPERPEVLDDDGAALAIPKDVDSTSPVVEPQPEMAEHLVHQLHPKDTRPAAAVLLGPVLARQHVTEGAHSRSVVPPTREDTWRRRSSAASVSTSTRSPAGSARTAARIRRTTSRAESSPARSAAAGS